MKSSINKKFLTCSPLEHGKGLFLKLSEIIKGNDIFLLGHKLSMVLQ